MSYLDVDFRFPQEWNISIVKKISCGEVKYKFTGYVDTATFYGYLMQYYNSLITDVEIKYNEVI